MTKRNKAQYSIALTEEVTKAYKDLPKSDKGKFLTASIELGNILGADICAMMIKANENGWTLNKETLLEIFTFSRNDFKPTEKTAVKNTESSTEKAIDKSEKTEASNIEKPQTKPSINIAK